MSNEAPRPQASNTTFDVLNHNAYTAGKADAQSYIGQYFIPRSLSHLGQEHFLSPQITREIVTRAQQTHLLILASRPDLKADHLVMRVAWELSDVIQRHGVFPNGVLFLECNSNLDLSQFDLSVELETIGTPCIVIIPSASPQHLGWDLPRVQRAALLTPHYIICSTTTPAQNWHLTKTDTQYWYELPRDAVYDKKYLTDSLTKQLIANKNALPKEIQGIIDPDKVLFKPLTIRRIAEMLQTDTNISVFVQLLCTIEHVNAVNVREIITLAQQSESEVLKKWFLTLPPREQLMALAISFFDGLVEEQVFSALQTLVTTVWMQTGTLGLFDYLEIERIRTFFPISDVSSVRPRFQGIFPKQRQILLKLAWDRYRVHIRTALPWLVQLAKTSMKHDAGYLELYGDIKQREQLRNGVSETLSDIGLISADAVQDALLWLVADDFYPVQVVAARTLANWYKSGQQQTFFAVLDGWSGTKRARAFIETALTQQYGENKYNTSDYIDPATVLAISYAAKCDQPNNIPARILRMLEQFIDTPSDKVVYCLNHYTLPMLLPLHLSQLGRLIRKMLLNVELHKSLTEAFVALYSKNKTSVLNILTSWREDALKVSPSSNNKLRDKSLAFVIRTFIAIWHIEEVEHSNRTIALNELYYIFQNENTNTILVGISIVDTIMAYTIQDSSRFTEIEDFLCSVIVEMNEQELIDLAQVLSNHYLQERINLKGGDDVFANKSEKTAYDTWIETTRPSTTSEAIYYTWLTTDYPKQVQILALYTSIAIAQRFELAEEMYREQALKERLERRRRQPRISFATNPSYTASQWVRALIDGWFDTLMYWLATAFLAYYRTFIRRVLPEMNRQYQNKPRAVIHLLNKWYNVRDISPMPLYASDVKTALKIMDKRNLVATVLVVIGVIGIMILALIYFSFFR